MPKRVFSERRKYQRMALHWAVRLKRPSSDVYLRTETQDLTTDGFYCWLPEAFEPGEVLECMIELPSSKTTPALRTLYGRATVLRVKHTRDDMYGVACQLEDYSLAAGSATAP